MRWLGRVERHIKKHQNMWWTDIGMRVSGRQSKRMRVSGGQSVRGLGSERHESCGRQSERHECTVSREQRVLSTLALLAEDKFILTII